MPCGSKRRKRSVASWQSSSDDTPEHKCRGRVGAGAGILHGKPRDVEPNVAMHTKGRGGTLKSTYVPCSVEWASGSEVGHVPLDVRND